MIVRIVNDGWLPGDFCGKPDSCSCKNRHKRFGPYYISYTQTELSTFAAISLISCSCGSADSAPPLGICKAVTLCNFVISSDISDLVSRYRFFLLVRVRLHCTSCFAFQFHLRSQQISNIQCKKTETLGTPPHVLREKWEKADKCRNISNQRKAEWSLKESD